MSPHHRQTPKYFGLVFYNCTQYSYICWAQWPRILRRRSAAARLLRMWVRIPPGAWMFVCCGCRVLSGRGLCDELITRPEESYRLCCVFVCDLENLVNEEAMIRVGSQPHKRKKFIHLMISKFTTKNNFKFRKSRQHAAQLQRHDKCDLESEVYLRTSIQISCFKLCAVNKQ